MFKGIRRKLSVFGQNMAYQRRKLFYPKNAETQRNMIADALRKAGPSGLTRDQIVVTTGIPLQSVTWRSRELLKCNCGIVREGEHPERETRQGGFAKVMFVA